MRSARRRKSWSLVLAPMVFGACGVSENLGGPSGTPASPSKPGGSSPESPGVAVDDGRGIAAEGITDLPECLAAEATEGNGLTWADGKDSAEVVGEPLGCRRRYTLRSTVPTREGMASNPRSIEERADTPFVRSGHVLFDALYALAQQEARDASVDRIRDAAFDDGRPLQCPAGGCFETGLKWPYVWTRDTAFAVALGLGVVDPTRARNSLEFKVSERRRGGDLQIMQDTGTGGGYPISSDRVAWALGAWELLKVLRGEERNAFRDLAYEALSNTLRHDRLVIFDGSDGLYGGEQSFLDWREQSYPGWAATDTVHIGLAKALSTNVLHYAALRVAEDLAVEKGDDASAATFHAWAQDLKDAVGKKFFLPEYGLFGTYTGTTLDPSVAPRFDLLGNALAALVGIASPEQVAAMLVSYPHLPKGPSVQWPQEQGIPIYHNRAQWPFVTGFWLKAAKLARHPDVTTEAVLSLMRGAAMHRSNMENFEAVTGAAWLEEGAASGPVVNSQRQLWSVGAYLAMVHDVLFGLEPSQGGIRFRPYVPKTLRQTLFGASKSLVLNRLRYRGRTLTIVLKLPPSTGNAGALVMKSLRVNGREMASDAVPTSALGELNLVEVVLDEDTTPSAPMRRVQNASDYRSLYAPQALQGVVATGQGDGVRLQWDAPKDASDSILVDVHRDGVRVASNLPGTVREWFDAAGAPGGGERSPCYTLRTRFVGTTHVSHASAPVCFWGDRFERVREVSVAEMEHQGGSVTGTFGRPVLEFWGNETDSLQWSGWRPDQSGKYLFQLNASNGQGPLNTGVTCGLKRVDVIELDTGKMVSSGYVMMPHTGSWSEFRGSSFLEAKLQKGTAYRVVVWHDDRAINMSHFRHFERYGGVGGREGPSNRVNVASIKVLYRGPLP